ncbi:MAG: hypothetical protein AAFQ22_12260 [Pseudomonadota bacterium]
MSHTLRLPYQSRAGFVFNIDPGLVEPIEHLIDEISEEVAEQKAAGKFFAYLSVPISSRGGGHFQTNTDMAAAITADVERQFGDQLWVLNPAKYNLPKSARGGDYMAVWADVLAGPDRKGSLIDMVYFVGPKDVWSFFGATCDDRIGTVAAWLDAHAKTSKSLKEIAEDPEKRARFLRYYAIRGSSAYSKGAHDEWNLVMRFNGYREIGDDIAVYFNGDPIEPGDYDDDTDAGYQLLLH